MDMALDLLAAEETIAATSRRAPPARVAAARADPVERQAYAPAGNRAAIVAVVAAHLVLLWALVHFDVIAVRKAPPQRLAVTMVDVAPPPPPHEQMRTAAAPKVEVPIVAPPPVVSLPRIAPPPVAVTPPSPVPVIAPPAPVAVSAPAAPAAAAKPAAVDIMADILDAPPPRFPVESRRLRESGTVRLRVTVSAEGRVAEVAVAQSSGHDRLDAAAIAAVRRWRFRPRVVAGAATEVIGTVPVTFNPPH